MVLSITLSLIVFALFGLIVSHGTQLSRKIQEQVEIQVYISSNISDLERNKIIKNLSLEPFVEQSVGSNAVQLISKEAAAKQFIEDTGEDFMSFLGENPLKDVLVVRIIPAFADTTNLSLIRQKLMIMPGIHDVSYIAGLTEKINQNILRIGLVLVGFAILLIISSILLINNTIKLAMFSQRFLIRSMQLVGATRWYIQQPFLWRAAWYGFISALIALAAVQSVRLYAYERIPELAELQNLQYELILAGIVIAAGLVLSTISSFFATSKYLHLSLDDLY